MLTSGHFPGTKRKRRLLNTVKNPLDKATIVSIYPRAIYETKPTIQPGIFSISPGTFEKPSLLVVGASSWWREMEEGMPMLEIPVSAISVAESVIRDKVNATLGASLRGAMPGLFFIPGEKTIVDILKNYKDLLEIARTKQREWFGTLVNMADALWAASHGSPYSVNDDMRLAASELNFRDKVWLNDYRTVVMVPCKFCGTLKSDLFPICQNCKQVTDPIRAKELGLIEKVS